jgi:hypothetical protein
MIEVSRTNGSVRLRGDAMMLRVALHRSCGIPPQDLEKLPGGKAAEPIPVKGRRDLLVQAIPGEDGELEYEMFSPIPPANS